MFDDLDTAIQQLLERELEIGNGEIEIKFNQPKREWSARLNRPTINLFMYDVRENGMRRSQSPRWNNSGGGGSVVTQTPQPFWTDLHYLVTIWANEPEDEHRLLANTLMALLRHPYIPDDLLIGDLANLPGDIILYTARYDAISNLEKFLVGNG